MRKYFEKIYQDGFEQFVNVLETKMDNEEKTFVITANPETLMIGADTPLFDEILKSDKTIIVPDGIGVVKAAHMLDIPVKERVTGVEIVQKLFELLNKKSRSLYLLGAKQEVLQKLVERIKAEYSNIELLGYQDGYIQNKDEAFEQIAELKPDVVLVALGIPAQEQLIYKHYDKFDKGIFVGVGGSFDVLSGTKKRAPKIFIKLNLEWLYRITKEPKRIKRFYVSNVKFISKIQKMKRQTNEN
jgi:N-acetylglucosaminyldiphosphoundecaprenol N-acetyl-beta-D-mannosaminyltransferase